MACGKGFAPMAFWFADRSPVTAVCIERLSAADIVQTK